MQPKAFADVTAGQILGADIMTRLLGPFSVIVFIAFLGGVSQGMCAELAAFPGAEGFGAVAVGGRGGRVIQVTTLAPNGPGSLGEACAAEGPRIVVFTVGGVIRGDIAIKHSRITIAGQTAPAPGITIEGRLLARPVPWRRLHDIVVRFLRLRPPPATGVGGDVVQLPDTERVILDHLSLAWANDETIDICHASEVTIQWCTLEESDIEGHTKGGFHNFGLISAYPDSGNISIHHNLFAHHSRRSPSLTPYVVGKPGDFRNNVIYNFREGLTHDGHVPVEAINLIGNYYKRGPDSDKIAPFGFHRKGKYYLEDNYLDGVGIIDTAGRLPAGLLSWRRLFQSGTRLEAPVGVAHVATHSAQAAYQVVLEQAGCFPRDRVTRRTIQEVRTGGGRWGRNGPAEPDDDWFLKGLGTADAGVDSDGDGMPDAWEEAQGLDRLDGSDHQRIMASGYSAIEDYINQLAHRLIEGASAH